jgi:competence/damage-inducible protein CinA-like protein
VPDRSQPSERPLLTAELLSVGSELLVGETLDTNSSELARSLSARGVTVTRVTALPDRLPIVTAAFRSALDRVDLVVSTGGLGPTPDDLTRESIAGACGETPAVDPALEQWLRRLWARRRLPFPEANVKQAWLIPSATALSNPNGTAPGWLVDRPDGRVIVALPGPPREMRPMWRDQALPRLSGRPGGLGQVMVTRTFRLTGIGESQVAEIIGDALLRGEEPEIATYARAEAVDVRISAVDRPGRRAATVVDDAAAMIQVRLGSHIWATGDTTWSQAIGGLLTERGWDIAVTETGTGGQVGILFGDVPWMLQATTGHGSTPGSTMDEQDRVLVARARATCLETGARVGLAVEMHEADTDTDVAVAIVTPTDTTIEHRTVFLGGPIGRTRAALAAAALLREALLRSAASDAAAGGTAADAAAADAAAADEPSADPPPT